MTEERLEEEKMLKEVYDELETENTVHQIERLLDDAGIPSKNKTVIDRIKPLLMLWNRVDASLRQRCLMSF